MDIDQRGNENGNIGNDVIEMGDDDRGESMDIVIKRPAWTESELMSNIRGNKWNSCGDGGGDGGGGDKDDACCIRHRPKCGKEHVRELIKSSFPVIGLMRGYKWRQWLLNDVMAGISVGFIHLPQGLGFSLLAGVPAVLGLYTSIIPAWLYYIFGTSRHISVGTMAVMSLLVGSYVNKFEYGVMEVVSKNESLVSLNNKSLTDSNQTGNDENVVIATANINNINMSNSNILEDHQRMNAATLLTLTVGCLQLLMWVGRMGVMSSYMSRSFVKSFIAGAIIHIVLNQLPFQLGYPLQRASGTFQLPINFYRVASNIAATNVPSLLTSIVCMAFLLSLKFFSTRPVAKKLKFPIPGELITVLIGTLVSFLVGFESRFNVKIIGKIPGGLPTPHLPSIYLLPSGEQEKSDPLILITDLLRQAIPIAIVCYALNITMAKLMADKHDYSVDSNQELFAIGIANTVSPFFGCFVAAQAHPRTLVIDSCQGKSPLASLFSTIVPILVISGTGFLFSTLPICVLGSVVSASLLPLLITEFIEFTCLWRVCRRDCVVWVFCFLSTVLLNVDIGIIVGIIGSGIAILVETRRGKLTLIRNVTNTELFIDDGTIYDDDDFEDGVLKKTNKSSNSKPNTMTASKIVKNAPNIKNDHIIVDDQDKNFPDAKNIVVLRLHGSIIFSNADVFKEQLLKSIQLKLSDEGNPMRDDKAFSSSSSSTSSPPPSLSTSKTTHRKYAILDFSRVSDVDATGLNVLKSCLTKIQQMDINVCVTCCSLKVKRKMEKGGLLSDLSTSSSRPHLLYPSVIDALVRSRKDGMESFV